MDGNRKSNVPFLAWFYFLPGTEKFLVDDCGLTLQTRWRENVPKKERINFQLPSVAQKLAMLTFPIKNFERAELTCKEKDLTCSRQISGGRFWNSCLHQQRMSWSRGYCWPELMVWWAPPVCLRYTFLFQIFPSSVEWLHWTVLSSSLPLVQFFIVDFTQVI